MNILMALSQLELTGAEVYATEIGNALTEQGHNVYYVSDTLTKEVKGKYYKFRFNKRSLIRRIWHIAFLLYLIKKHKIQLVHAHSRAAGWSSFVACKISRTAILTTVHGRQPVHRSRKKFHAFGKPVAICKEVAEQIITELGVARDTVEILPNGIDLGKFNLSPPAENLKPVISIIGRLSGPKGDLCYEIIQMLGKHEKFQLRVIGGSELPERFKVIKDSFEFTGFSKNLPRAIETNFGDIAKKSAPVTAEKLLNDIQNALKINAPDINLIKAIQEHYSLARVVTKLKHLYQTEIVYSKRRDIPILMYHRVIKEDEQPGKYRIFVTLNQLEKHFKLMRFLGYETITFADFSENGLDYRLNPDKKYVMLTFDDGYQDNYYNLLPLLKKYKYKAVIYAVTGAPSNIWDQKHGEVELPLLTKDMIKQMAASGHVEFGGHTSTHPKLPKLNSDIKLNEIKQNKTELEIITQDRIHSFAYPYGMLDKDSKQQVKKAGFNYAVATDSGPLAMHEDLFAIRRIGVFPGTGTFGLWRKIRGNYNFRKSSKMRN